MMVVVDAGPDRHPYLAIGKRMDSKLVKRHAQSRGETGGVARGRRQALNDHAHGVVSTDAGCRAPMTYPLSRLAAVAARSSSDWS